MIELKDRIYTLCDTVGTGNIVVGTPRESFQGWDVIQDGNSVYYCVVDNTQWEVGHGIKTGTSITRNVISSSTGAKLELGGNASVFCTYPAEKSVYLDIDGNVLLPDAEINANKFIGDGNGITNIDAEANSLITEAPDDNLTYARNNKKWVSISDTSGIPDAPVDNVMYGRKNGEWGAVADAGDIYTKTETNNLLDNKADKSTTYTKSEVDLSQQSQDSLIQANTDAIANLPTPVDTYTKTEIDDQQQAQDNAIDTKADQATTYTKTEVDASQGAQDTEIAKKANQATTYTKTEVDALQGAQDTKIDKNKTDISSNTSAIGTLSGRVSANEQDIATLQDGIFFSSSYTADYPDNPNRDPETGNIYLQNISAFTYSYADANQVFISKTDEQGNTRAFTAVKPDDTIVLNQVESPNYGRYKVTAVNDLGDYVNLIVEFQIGEGTLLEGDIVALQAFPASAGGGGGGSLPKGSIIMWSDPTVPEGWQICDGTNDTPDLRNRFLVGAGSTYGLNATGGSKDAVVVNHGHSLSGTADSNGAHTHGMKGTISTAAGSTTANQALKTNDLSYVINTESDGAHTHSVSGNANATGVDGANKNLPPYYALYYIMKTTESSSFGSGNDKLIEQLTARLNELEKRVN